MRSENEKRRQIEKIDKLRRRHRRHKEWIMDARDWETEPNPEKWLEMKLLHYHDPQGWLLTGAQGEDAKNIGALVLRMPPDRFARRFARLLLKDIIT